MREKEEKTETETDRVLSYREKFLRAVNFAYFVIFTQSQKILAK